MKRPLSETGLITDPWKLDLFCKYFAEYKQSQLTKGGKKWKKQKHSKNQKLQV